MKCLKELRLANNLTQEALAQKLGVARSTITMWENGLSKPRLDTLVRLANVLDCTIDALLKDI